MWGLGDFLRWSLSALYSSNFPQTLCTRPRRGVAQTDREMGERSEKGSMTVMSLFPAGFFYFVAAVMSNTRGICATETEK